MKKNEFIIIAHRGESYDAPENTHASINLAWKRNDDAVEIDVQLTKDERIVAIHDKSTLRTGGKLKRISSNTYNNLLLVDVGKFKGKKWKDERIPLLDDVIDKVPENKVLFIEVKSDYRIIKSLKNFIRQKFIEPDQIKFIGFDINTMKLIKKTLPEFQSYWIIEGKHYKSKSALKSSVEGCKAAGLDGLHVQARKYLNSEVIQCVKNNGLKIYTWTVDDPERATQIYMDGIDGITTNRASWLKEKLKDIKYLL
ncbi:MAG: glycerophosphodiester phosphodiesterase family protein [Ignavibacteriaceae bacterium]